MRNNRLRMIFAAPTKCARPAIKIQSGRLEPGVAQSLELVRSDCGSFPAWYQAKIANSERLPLLGMSEEEEVIKKLIIFTFSRFRIFVILNYAHLSAKKIGKVRPMPGKSLQGNARPDTARQRQTRPGKTHSKCAELQKLECRNFVNIFSTRFLAHNRPIIIPPTNVIKRAAHRASGGFALRISYKMMHALQSIAQSDPNGNLQNGNLQNGSNFIYSWFF